jgi:predicted site-specific integrase-resolvase
MQINESERRIKNMDANSGNWIRRHGAARRAGVTVRTIDNWRKEGKITTYLDETGRVWINADEIDKLTTPRAVISV